MWNCSKCATENLDTQAYCHRCGGGISSQHRGKIKSLSQIIDELKAAQPKPGQSFCPRCKTYAWFNRESHTTTTGAVGIPVLGGTVFRPIQSTSSTLRCSNCGGDVMRAYANLAEANKTDEQRQVDAEGDRMEMLLLILFFVVVLAIIGSMILSVS